MQIVAQGTVYTVTVTNEERGALVWACELAKAVVEGNQLGNPNLHILIAEEAVDVGQLDALADKLFLAGWHQSAA